MELLLRDVRYALGSMRRNPGFAVAGLLTLALGIGLTATVFTLVYGVLARPLPFRDADRLVQLSEEHPGANSPLRAALLSNLTYHAWMQRATTVEQLAAYSYSEFTVELPGGTARLTGAPVTPSLFSLVDATPARGRLLVADDARPGADGVVVLSDRLWRERFAAAADAVGRSVLIDGRPHTVVGVTQPGFAFPVFEARGRGHDAQLWTALAVAEPSPDAVAGQRGRMGVVFGLARLRPGVSLAQAEAEGTAAARSTVRPMAANLLFGVGGPPVVHVRGIVTELTARVRPSLLVLGAAVVCVLLIACANVASLFLVRGVARQRELTVRAALGAGRGRLIRQLLTESLVFSGMGGVCGFGLAAVLVRLTRVLAGQNFPRLDAVALDGRALAVTALVTTLTGVFTGLIPALRSTRPDLATSLHGGDGASAGGFRGATATWWRDTLVVAEAAFAVLLLVAALLLSRSFVRLLRVDAGYSANGVLVAELFLPEGDRPESGGRMRALVSSVVDRARAMPGVSAAGAGNMMPLDSMTQIAGFPAPWTRPGGDRVSVRSLQYVVTPGYAEALALRLRRGRLFRESDLGGDVQPWVVNEEFARLYLPPDPIGYRWTTTSGTDSPPQVNEIVGVVSPVLKLGNDAAVQPEHYQLAREPMRFRGHVEVVVRAQGNPAALAPAMREAISELAPGAAIETVTLSERLASTVEQPRFALTVMVGLAALALALASVGVYGVLAYGVSQRRRELGIRSALGATRADLISLVVRDGLRVTAMGLVVGLAAAWGLTRYMQGALFGVQPLDLVSFAAAPLILGIVAFGACLLPARRAASIDPAEALRAE